MSDLIRQTWTDGGAGDLADYAVRLADVESGLNPNARNPRSSAGGLFQQIDENWASYGASGDRFNPVHSSRAALAFTQANRRALRAALGRDPEPYELYLAHQQGPGGAIAILRNPNAPADTVVKPAAIKLNGGWPGMTAGQFAELWRGRFAGKGTTSGLISAAGRSATTVGALVSSVAYSPRDRTVDESFDPIERIKGTALEPWADKFIDVRNEEEFRLRASHLLQLDADRRELDAGGLLGTAAMLGVGLLDPMTLLVGGPAIGGFVKGAAWRGLLRGAGYAGVTAAAQEGIFQATQPLRTAEESAYNIGTATILGGLLGGAAGILSGRALRRVTEAAAEAIDTGKIYPETAEAPMFRGAGAEATAQVPLAEMQIAGRGTRIAAAALGTQAKYSPVRNPDLSLASSPSRMVREYGMALSETHLNREMHRIGKSFGPSAEGLIRHYMGGKLSMWEEKVGVGWTFRSRAAAWMGVPVKESIYSAYRKAARAAGEPVLDINDFMRAVGRASIVSDDGSRVLLPDANGKLRPLGAEAAKAVSKAARALRDDVVVPFRDMAIKAGLLSQKQVDSILDTAESYFHRVYDVREITKRRPEFIDFLAAKAGDAYRARNLKLKDVATSRYFETARRLARDLKSGKLPRPEYDRLYKAAKARLDRRMNKNDLPLTEAAEIARQITDKISGWSRGIAWNMREMIGGPTGALADRTLRFVSDAELQAGRWMVEDAREVAHSLWRSMAPDIVLKNLIGDTTGERATAAINDDFDNLIRATPKKAEALAAQRERDVADVMGIIRRIKGVFDMPDSPQGLAMMNAADVAKAVQFSRSLGGMVISSISDVPKIIAYGGMWRTMRQAFIPMITNWRGLRILAEEARRANVANDMMRAGYYARLANIGDGAVMSGRAQRYASWLTSTMSRVFLADIWNQGVQSLAGIVAQGRVIDGILAEAAGNIAAKERTLLRRLGIGEYESKIIGDELKAHHGDVEGLRVPNTEAWTNQEAVAAYRSALGQMVGEIIVTPGQDKPFWMSKSWGSVLSQFQSFGVASTQRTLLYAMQQHDAASFIGLSMMIASGALTVYLRSIIGGWDPPETPEQWLWESIDASGIAAWISGANMLLERSSAGGLGLRAWTSPEQARRRYATGNIASFLGPTGQMAADFMRVAYDTALGQYGSTDTHLLRKMVPMQNYFFLRRLFDEGEDSVNDMLGVRSRQ